ncbi:MAG: hypothetical protein ACXAAO_01525 [Candidatus Thorarchaeota archaeon]
MTLDKKEQKELDKKRKKESKALEKLRKDEEGQEAESPIGTKTHDAEESKVVPTPSRGFSWKGVVILVLVLFTLVSISFMVSIVSPFLGGALLTVGGILLAIARDDIRKTLGLE